MNLTRERSVQTCCIRSFGSLQTFAFLHRPELCIGVCLVVPRGKVPNILRYGSLQQHLVLASIGEMEDRCGDRSSLRLLLKSRKSLTYHGLPPSPLPAQSLACEDVCKTSPLLSIQLFFLLAKIDYEDNFCSVCLLSTDGLLPWVTSLSNKLHGYAFLALSAQPLSRVGSALLGRSSWAMMATETWNHPIS